MFDLVQCTFKFINTYINQYWDTVNNFMWNKTTSIQLYHNDVFIVSYLQTSKLHPTKNQSRGIEAWEVVIVNSRDESAGQSKGRRLWIDQYPCAEFAAPSGSSYNRKQNGWLKVGNPDGRWWYNVKNYVELTIRLNLVIKMSYVQTESDKLVIAEVDVHRKR